MILSATARRIRQRWELPQEIEERLKRQALPGEYRTAMGAKVVRHGRLRVLQISAGPEKFRLPVSARLACTGLGA